MVNLLSLLFKMRAGITPVFGAEYKAGLKAKQGATNNQDGFKISHFLSATQGTKKGVFNLKICFLMFFSFL